MKLIHLSVLFCVVAGCRAYVPAPVDWAQERAAWAEASAVPARLTLADAKRCALFLNPEINALRVRHLASSNAVLQTGWWDDPEFGVDALRFLRSTPHAWIVDSTLAFTIPINGVPALERRAAGAYAFADACTVIVAERELMATIERAWHQRLNVLERHQFLSDTLRLFEGERETVKQLVAAGELNAREEATLQLDVSRMKAELRNLALAIETQRLSLMQLTGLHPSVPVMFDDAGNDAADLPAPTEDMLLRHPNVQEKLARLDASEADLRTEIRRQYPNLTIGPALAHEEGTARAGLTFGMTLPLWNRNRKAVAEAEGARQQARIEAVNEWKRLVGELALAKETLRLAEENERQCRETELPAALQSCDSIRQLYDAGEADITALLAALQTSAESRLNGLDAKQALKEAQITLSQFAEHMED